MNVFVDDLSDIVRLFTNALEFASQRPIESGDIGTVHDKIGARFHPFDLVVGEVVMDADADAGRNPTLCDRAEARPMSHPRLLH